MRAIAALGFVMIAAGQTPPPEPPKVLRIVREAIKPGKSAMFEKTGASVARAFARSKYPANFLALNSASGEPEVWILESHDSFASIENADAFLDKNPGLKWWLSQYEAQDGDAVPHSRRLLAAYRPDLSYRGEQLAASLPKMRYVVW